MDKNYDVEQQPLINETETKQQPSVSEMVTEQQRSESEAQMEKKNRNSSLKSLIMAALFAAMITVVTAYVAHVPIGVGGGYLHFGDALIYIAACILPMPYAVGAAVIGAGMADLLTAPVWIPATVIIKALSVLLFSSRKTKIICTRNLWCLPIAACLTIGGYYVAEALIYGNWTSPVLSMVGNLIQAGGSILFFVILGFALDQAGLKKRL